MAEFYTVDRRGWCHEGGKLSLITDMESRIACKPQPEQTASDLKKTYGNMFPEGVSRHGIKYLLEHHDVVSHNGSHYLSHSNMIELIWEAIRRESYPERPSRMQSYFGFKEIDDTMRFMGKNDRVCLFRIYQVRCEAFFEADMSLLKQSHNGIGAFDYAHRYWSGEKSKTPEIEYLLRPEVEILTEVPPPDDWQKSSD